MATSFTFALSLSIAPSDPFSLPLLVLPSAFFARAFVTGGWIAAFMGTPFRAY
jgi:hypothetical protein